MFEQIKALLSKFTKEEITENSSFTSDLGLSSFDVVSIVTAFEDEFDIEIPDRDIRKLVKVEDAINYINDRI